MPGNDRIELQSWIRHRDANAFKQLAMKYSALVYGTCLRITRDRCDAEDLTQECFAALASQSAPPRAPVGAWLHRVATNRSLNQVKARVRRMARETGYAAARPQSAEIGWSDIDGLVDEAIAGLPEELQAVVVAHFLESESYTAIAARLGTTRQTVTNRVEKGVELIRRALMRRGVKISAPALTALFATELAHAAPVPVSVSLSLGKLALSGVAEPAALAQLTGGLNALGGVVSMKTSVVGAGVAVAVIAGAAFTTHQFREQRNELERVRDANRVLNAQAADAALVEQELHAARAEIARLTVGNGTNSYEGTAGAETAALSPDSLAGGNAEAVRVDGAVSHVVDDVAFASNDGGEVGNLHFEHILLNSIVTEGKVYEAQILSATNERYAALFGILKLPGDVQGHVRAALADHIRSLAYAGVSFGDLSDGIIDTQSLRETLGTILTPEELARWEAFENDVPYFQAEQRFATEMTQVLPTLSPNNRDLASAVLADEQLLGEAALDPDASRTDELTSELEALDRAEARIATASFDADQMALVRDYINQRRALIQAQIEQYADGNSGLNFEAFTYLSAE